MKITDKMRLDWVGKNRVTVTPTRTGYCAYGRSIDSPVCHEKTIRRTIDAAIRAEKERSK